MLLARSDPLDNNASLMFPNADAIAPYRLTADQTCR